MSTCASTTPYNSYIAPEDRSDSNAGRIELGAQRTDKNLHRRMGVKPGGPLPDGAYLRTTVVGFKVVKSSPDGGSTWLLSRVAQKAGEIEKEEISYTGTLVASRWEAGDWKLSTKSVLAARQVPEGQRAPKGGDKAFNAAGWTAIRQAS
ncbi:hypothetical protein ACF06P_39650 [Streptomyces sp. NPDC015684]|uniref:hypothetical protein n=1 Tax=Streptomyces sp. NPDC015684 TaxID=3364963 RepID=UPI0036FDC1DB